MYRYGYVWCANCLQWVDAEAVVYAAATRARRRLGSPLSRYRLCPDCHRRVRTRSKEKTNA